MSGNLGFFYVIVLFFLASAIFIPIIEADFGISLNSITSIISLQNTVKTATFLPVTDNESSWWSTWLTFLYNIIQGLWIGIKSLIKVIAGLALMATYSMGIIPLYIELIIYFPLRIIFWIIIWNQFWGQS